MTENEGMDTTNPSAEEPQTDVRVPTGHAVIQGYLKTLDEPLETAGGRIATVSGRYYAMDRDRRWDRTELAWRAMVDGEGRHAASGREAVELAYAEGEDDEFIRPTVIAGGEPIRDGDQVIHINFRKDRPRQLPPLPGAPRR